MDLKKSALKIFFFLFFLAGITCSCSRILQGEGKDSRPNILLIVADDLGYADLGCYGSDIETPNIDSLAHAGIRFSRFYTASTCAPTRAMLLSGNDSHIAGMGQQSLRTDEFGYEGCLTSRIVTLPSLLRDAGYHTYMAGKWHLGNRKADNPHSKGFEHSFTLLLGAGNHYNDQGLFENHPRSPYTEDGKPVRWIEGNYSTDFYTDKLIAYMDRHKKDGKPFFAFAAYTSPHWPLQVDEAYWKKYQGRYDEGYENLKERRMESLKRAGMIPENAESPPNDPKIKPWESLSDKEKRMESRKMELYAGMVDNLDENVGRLVQHLKDLGEYENTIIVFMSDTNGAAAEDFYYDNEYGPFIRAHFNVDYNNMGNPNSFISYAPPWAEAGSAPFRLFKGYTTEGGVVAPMILSGPGIQRKNEIHHGFVTLMDLAPTFYEAANVSYPKTYNGREVYPLKGKSMLKFADGKAEQVHSRDYVFGFEQSGRALIRKGNWKITNISRPFMLEYFELYDLSTDLAELHDLRKTEPEKYQELIDEWFLFSREIEVQFPTPLVPMGGETSK